MKNIKKPLSLLLSLIMVFSMFSIIYSTTASAAPVYSSSPELAQETVQGGAILHCFCWSYNEIKNHMDEIAEAGYTAVQTSPVQKPKDYNPGYNRVSNWWAFYQPMNLSLTNSSWLGTQTEFAQMCNTAHNYGVKVIVDIVANHLAWNDNTGLYYSGIDSDLQNSDYFHVRGNYSDPSRGYEVRENYKADLNTENTDIQSKVISLLEDCVDGGADGFRFDAAKHIELGKDEDGATLGSDFWENVIDAVNRHTQKDLFLYGELLGAPYGKNSFEGYLNYFDAVTDSNTSDNTRYNVVNNHVSNIYSDYNYNTGAGDCVLWAESHDTYMNSGGVSQNVSNEDIVRTWAVVGSRNDSTSLFFARPKNNTTVTSDTTWKSTAVTEVNKFKNLFDGQSEYLSAKDNTFYNERGTKGVVISVKDGGEVRLPAHKMADGTYTDHVSNTSFSVSNGVISGTVGDTGVAVVYNANDIEDTSSGSGTVDDTTLFLKPNTGSNSWNQGNERYAMYFYGSNGDAWSSMTDPDGDGIYSGTVPEGSWTNVIFCRMNGSTTENNWNNKWCQTGDLTLAPATYNLYTIDNNVTQDTNPATGSWSMYTPSGSSGSHTHTFGEPSWTWSADYSSAVATFTCADCDESFSFTDSNTTLNQSSISEYYAAEVVVNGKEYTGRKYVDLGGRIYLKPGSWKVTGTRFAAYFFGTDNPKWVSMSEVSGTNGAYCCADIPDGDWTNVIFCRMKENTSNDWDNRYGSTPEYSQTNDLELSDGNCYEITSSGSGKASGSWSEYTDNSILYSTSGGDTISLTGKIDRDAEDTVLQNIPNAFKNLQILGVQKKAEITDNRKAVRFVAVLNNTIAQDAAEYGFIAVGSSTKARARENITNLTLDTANENNVFACKSNGVGSDNNVSGNYGKFGEDTNYKYVTFAVNNIAENAVAVKFYVKNQSGNVFYADYTDRTGEMFNNCSTDWSSLEEVQE